MYAQNVSFKIIYNVIPRKIYIYKITIMILQKFHFINLHFDCAYF
jgi:hypothetical protein